MDQLSLRGAVALRIMCAMISNPESFGSDIMESEDWKGVDDPELYKHMALTAHIAADAFMAVTGDFVAPGRPAWLVKMLGEKDLRDAAKSCVDRITVQLKQLEKWGCQGTPVPSKCMPELTRISEAIEELRIVLEREENPEGRQ